MTQPPEIRETDVLHQATGAVAQREEGRIVVYVLSTMSGDEKKKAVREALRALRRQERGRRGLVLIPAAGAVRLAVQHPGQAVMATAAAATAGAAIYSAVPPLRPPSAPQAPPPAVTRVAPHPGHGRRAGTGPVISPVPLRTAAQVPPSPRPSPHRSAPEPPHPGPSTSASPSPSPTGASPSPLVTVAAAASPSPGLANAACITLLGIRVCV